MNTVLKASRQSFRKTMETPMKGFLKVLAFYGSLFAFWVSLFINNEGPGGVEEQHLVLMGIIHVLLVSFHALAIFKVKEIND